MSRKRILVLNPPKPEGDSASGVALLLSDKAAKKVVARGEDCGSRLVWVRLQGRFHDLIVVGAYIPHWQREDPRPRARGKMSWGISSSWSGA